MVSRRDFLKLSAAASAGLLLSTRYKFIQRAFAAYVMDNTLDPASITPFLPPMVIPPAMPRTGKVKVKGGKNIDYYEIAVRQFGQQILPASQGFPETTVWSYGSLAAPGTVAQGGSFNYPAFTIEAKWTKSTRVKWINDLGNMPHLLPVDPSLHWANPIGPVDTRPSPTDAAYWGNSDLTGENGSYIGPVPIVTHVHGAHTTQESDGYPEAWFLAANASANYTSGTFYNQFKAEFEARYPGDPMAVWSPGSSVFEYPNDMRATTLWYHDHTLGMTRLNVYAGPAGFYLIRGGPDDMVLDAITGAQAILPGPAPALGDPPGMVYHEIPVVIQDRSFDQNGQLWYPYYRAFFEGLGDIPEPLQIPFTPDVTLGGEYSDVAPIWQPEFFGNVMVVNGVSWPHLDVEARRYRLRFLNGCNSRFLILRFDDPGVQVWQIGADGGFLAAPVQQNQLLMAPAERADVIVDFTNATQPVVTLHNDAPDAPYGGTIDPEDLTMPEMRQVMQFNVGPAMGVDNTTFPQNLVLPAFIPADPPGGVGGVYSFPVRPVSLNEEESKTVLVPVNADGDFVFDTAGTLWEVAAGEAPTETEAGSGIWVLARLGNVEWSEPWEPGPFGPTSALLGTVDPNTGDSSPMLWMDPVSENPTAGSTEIWQIHNFTMDAHPIHIHLVQFQVVDRQIVDEELSPHFDPMATPVGTVLPPEPGESGFKDTVIAYPGEITRVQARFDTPGRFVWHCHIVEHEDNEMMRPYDVV